MSDSVFLNSGITFCVLQSLENYLVSQERFTKYNIGADKSSAQVFNIDFGERIIYC